MLQSCNLCLNSRDLGLQGVWPRPLYKVGFLDTYSPKALSTEGTWAAGPKECGNFPQHP